MIFMCCCALTLFDKASEIFFSMRENNPAVAHKHIFAENYNVWRNFQLMHLFFARFFGIGPKNNLYKGFIVFFTAFVAFFCFYSVFLLGWPGIYEVVFPSDQNIDVDHWFKQIMVEAGVLTPIMPGFVKVSYLSLLGYQFVVISPMIILISILFLNNIVVTGYLLAWLAKKRRPFWQTGGAIIVCTAGTFISEILLIAIMLIFIYFLSIFTSIGFIQEGKFDAQQHSVGWGMGIDIGTKAKLGGRVWSDPVFTQEDIINTKSEPSLIDAFTHKYNGSPEKDVRLQRGNNTEESSATCEFSGISEAECVKRMRTLLFRRIASHANNPAPDGPSITKNIMETFSYASPYVCSAASRSAIRDLFQEDWQKYMVELVVVPLYVLLAMYIVRLIFSTIIPFAVVADFVVIRQARKIFKNNEVARTHVLRHFSYFSLLPIAASIWLISRLSSLFC